MLAMKDLQYHIGIKLKIYPCYKQKYQVTLNDGAKRAVYNHLVATDKEIYYLSKTANFVPSDRKRIEYLKSVRVNPSAIQNALPFLYDKDVDSQAVANAIQSYRRAWKNQKELHTGVPTFKRKSYVQSYQTNPHYNIKKDGTIACNVRFEDYHHIILPKLGRIRFDGSPKYVKEIVDRINADITDIRIGTITVSRDAVGEYWVSLSLASDKPFRKPLPKTGNMHGIDLNLIELVNDSEENAMPNKKFFVSSQEKLKKEQQKLSHKRNRAEKEGREFYKSKNYQKQREKVAYINRKITRQREDYLHVISKQEVKNQDLVVAEDLKIRNLVKNHKLAKAISDAGWRKLLTMLQYKAELYGKEVILIPPQNTIKTCSECGYVLQGDERLTLSDREWTCPKCKTYHLRDINAAKVILQKGLEQTESDPPSMATH